MAIPTAEEMEAHFPSGLRMPQELRLFCSWVTTNGYPISGYFRLRSDSYEAVKHWFGKDDVVHRFGMFGAGADGSLYCLWTQDNGAMVVVHMDSEGEKNFVLARDFVEFLGLLAIGYGELGFEDLSMPPHPDGINPGFQQWVQETFQTSLPARGSEIVELARRECQDFKVWVKEVVST